jgi:hypothetical protein
VVVDQLQRLPDVPGIEAAEDQRVALARRDGPQIEHMGRLDQGCSHGTFQGKLGITASAAAPW